MAERPKEDEPGFEFDDGRRKMSVSDSAMAKLLSVIGGDLRWIVRAIGWGIAFVATCYGVSLLI